MNMTQPIWRNCHAYPQREALLVDGRSVSYGQMLRLVERVQFNFHSSGVRRGDVVALCMNDPLRVVITMLALARMGAIIAPYSRTWEEERAKLLMHRHQARFLVHSPRDAATPALFSHVAPIAVDALFAPPAALDAIAMADMGYDDAWLIVTTSGTTGVPKSIKKKHGTQILASTLTRNHTSDSIPR